MSDKVRLHHIWKTPVPGRGRYWDLSRDHVRVKALFLAVLFFAVAAGVSGQTFDFVLTTSGAHHVAQGHYMFFQVNPQVISGVDDQQVVPSVSGLPSGATADFVDMEKFCCGTTLYRVVGSQPVKISTLATTPVGSYALTVTYKTLGGVQRSTNFTLYIDPVPGPISKVTPPADTPLASLAKWESNMTTYGADHCVASEMSSIYSGYVWFYDGIRVYHQIGDYTGDHTTWEACAAMVTSLYRGYVLTNNGSIPGYYVLGKGLAMNYQRTGDLLSKQAVDELRANSAYASQTDAVYSIDWSRSREVAFGLEAHTADESTGATRNTAAYNDLVELIFGHFSQWFLDQNTPIVQPFMVALSAEALLEYWQQSHDPRVPAMLQLAADRLWAKSWDLSCNCFRYYDDTLLNGSYTLSQDLNLLIAPLYGWLFQQTGQQNYRDEGDAIFNSGVANAYLGDLGVGGKQFSQNYRWSGKYVEWRSTSPSQNTPAVAITSPTTAPSLTTSNSTINLGGTAFDTTGITQVSWATDHGTSGFATGTANWTINGLALPSGSTRVTVTARNVAGNQASAAITLTLASSDATPPTIAITSPTSGSSFTTSSNTINIGGTASDNVGVTQISWVTSRGASGTATGTNSWAINGLALVSGSTGVTVTAHDAAGNVASAILNVTYTAPDSTPPTISITSPTSGPTFTAPGSSINLSGTAADNVGVTQVTWISNRGGSGIATGTSSWTINGLILASGTTGVTVTARDAAGNVASAILNITYSAPDTTPPTINITSPTSGSTYTATGSSPVLAGTSSDDVGVAQVTWATDHGSGGIATGTTNWMITGLVLQPGTTQVTVTAGDAAGNASSKVLTITYTPSDTVAPSISITSPTAAATYSTSSNTIALAGTASDNTGVTQVIWVTDRGASGSANGTNSWTIGSVPLQSGTNSITVTARDAAGNQGTATLVVTYSSTNTGAAVTITSPTTDATYHVSQSTINLGGTAPNTTTQITWASDQGTQGVGVGTTTWTAGGIGLKKGSNKITVIANDNAGKQTSAQITVMFSNPAITSTNPPPGKAGKLYSYQLNAVDGIPPLSWSAVSLPEGLELNQAGTVTGTPVTTGTFAVNVSVRDSADGQATATVRLQVDTWLSLVSGASLVPGPVAPGSMATAFGWQLAGASESATVSPLPIKLGERTVTVRDANGVERPSSLYFVSTGQINFTIPADTAVGPAVATVYDGNNQILATGSLYVVGIAPALFFMNQDGLAAAGLVRVQGDTVTYEPVVQMDDTTHQFVPVPIDLGSSTDQVYLTLYGTGFRNRSSLDSVHVYIGDVLVPVTYAGPAGFAEGLDIVNVLLPQELRGKGTANVLLTVNGATANVVQVVIK